MIERGASRLSSQAGRGIADVMLLKEGVESSKGSGSIETAKSFAWTPTSSTSAGVFMPDQLAGRLHAQVLQEL